MPDHICPHAQDIGAMRSTLKRIEGAVDGNGSKGLLKDVTILKEQFKEMNADLGTIARSTSAFAQSQLEQDTIEKEKIKVSEKKAKAFQRVGIVASIVFGAVGALAIVLNFIKTTV